MGLSIPLSILLDQQYQLTMIMLVVSQLDNTQL